MYFAHGFAAAGGAVAVAVDAAEGLLADDHGAVLDVVIEDELVGAVDLVVGEHAIVEDEPAGAPPAPVVHPLVEDAGDAVADDVAEHDLAACGGVLAGEARGGGALHWAGGGVVASVDAG